MAGKNATIHFVPFESTNEAYHLYDTPLLF